MNTKEHLAGLVEKWRGEAEEHTLLITKAILRNKENELDAILATLPASVDGAARRRDVRLWMQHNACRYSTATELAEAADDVFRLPNGGLDNETHWVWDEAVEAIDDAQRGGEE